MDQLSIRSRLILLIILSALPAFGLSIYNGLERRAQAERNARGDLTRLAALAAKRQEETIEGARQLLFAVAETVDSLRQDAAACQDYFIRLVGGSDGLYRSMGIQTPEGRLICGAAGGKGDAAAGDRRHFRLAAQS